MNPNTLFIMVGQEGHFIGLKWQELKIRPKIDEVFQFEVGFNKWKVIQDGGSSYGYDIFIIKVVCLRRS